MTQQIALPDDTPSHNPHYSDAFVVFSVTVLSCAVGAWLLLRLGLTLWMGSVAALAVYALLLSFHLLVRRSLAASPAELPAVARRPGRLPERPDLPLSAPLKVSDCRVRCPFPMQASKSSRRKPSSRHDPADAPPPLRLDDPFNFRPSREPSLSTHWGRRSPANQWDQQRWANCVRAIRPMRLMRRSPR